MCSALIETILSSKKLNMTFARSVSDLLLSSHLSLKTDILASFFKLIVGIS